MKELYELHKVQLSAHGWSILLRRASRRFALGLRRDLGLLRILEKFSAWPFVFYRAFIGVVLIIAVMFGWLAVIKRRSGELAGLAEAPQITRKNGFHRGRVDAEPLQRAAFALGFFRNDVIGLQKRDLIAA